MSGSHEQDQQEGQGAREPQYSALFHGAPSQNQAVLPPPSLDAPAASAHWLGWAVMTVTIGTVIGFASVGYLKYVDGPVESKPDKSLSLARKSVSPTPQPPNMFGGLTIEFQYPAVFDMVGQVKTDSQALEQYTIGSKADYSRGISVNVRPLPSGLLEDDSSYRFRQTNTAEYRLAADKIAGEPVAIFSKLDKREQTLFWAHDGREVIVSLTSGNPKDDLTGIMNGIKTSLRWRR